MQTNLRCKSTRIQTVLIVFSLMMCSRLSVPTLLHAGVGIYSYLHNPSLNQNAGAWHNTEITQEAIADKFSSQVHKARGPEALDMQERSKIF